MIAEWGEVNRKLRHHGYQHVLVLPSSRLQQIPVGKFTDLNHVLLFITICFQIHCIKSATYTYIYTVTLIITQLR